MIAPLPTMSAAEFDAALNALGLADNASAAARALGSSPRAVRFWRQGQRHVPGPVVVLLRVLVSLTA